MLLLKAAMPMLASAAAQRQGVSVAQVCDVYGVAVSAAAHAHHHAGHDAHRDSGDAPAPASHQGDHCALNALSALATHDALSHAVSGAFDRIERATLARVALVPDASALWAARLQHAPPATS
jgi:hypothetical protein